MRRPHENVATVLVDPSCLRELELALMTRDLWVWPVASAPVVVDGPRRAFQIRRRLVEAHQGAWDCAADWTPVWISFGDTWRTGEDPLPWEAHRALYDALGEHADAVRFRKGLGGIDRLPLPRGLADRHADHA